MLYWFSLFIKFTTTLTITSFSSVRLSAIIKVSATRVLSAMRLCPSLNEWFFLHPDGTSHQPHHVLKFVVSVELELLVDDVAFDEVLLENGGCPTTKRCCILAIYSISYGNNHIKIVIWYFSNYLSLSLYSNLCIFCTS